MSILNWFDASRTLFVKLFLEWPPIQCAILSLHKIVCGHARGKLILKSLQSPERLSVKNRS